MACGFYKTDENGDVRKSPTTSKLIEYIDTQLANNEAIDPNAIVYRLYDDGVIGASGRVNPAFQSMLMQEVDDINAVSMLHYGSPVPLLAVHPYNDNGNTRYNVQVSVQAIENMSPNFAPRVKNANIAYDYNYEAFKFNMGYIGVIKPYNREAVETTAAEQRFTESTRRQSRPGEQLDMFGEQDSRNFRDNEEVVSISSVQDEITRMTDAFAKAGINVEVQIDPELPVKGRIISNAGGKVTIKLNPSKFTEDTHYHEFSHLLIELLGDNNPVVTRAINELKNTNLYEEVKAVYPELTEAELDKEVLVTAMGLSGAKIVKQNPNLFQRIFNRVVRALSKAFNLESRPSAVEELTKMLLEGRITKVPNKSLTYFMYDSRTKKQEEEFMKIVDDVRISTQETIEKLKRDPGDKEAAIEAISLMQKRLDKVKDVEDLMEFINYATRLADRAEENLEKIAEQDSENISSEERLQLLQQLNKVSEYVYDFYGARDGKDSIMDKIAFLVGGDLVKLRRNLTEEEREKNPKYKSLSSLERKLMDAVFRMKAVDKNYRDTGIPLMADLLMSFNEDAADSVNGELNILIKNITDNKRIVAIERDAEYNIIKEKEKKKEITAAEAKEALLKLNVEQLKNKLVNRDTLIKELTENQKDKSRFSYLLDPIIYSSQAGLQMFASMLKEKMYQANDDTRDDIAELSAAYKEFAAFKGNGLNANAFNDDIVETHDYYVFNPETNKTEKTSLLSFVQPYDVTRYRANEAKMYEETSKKYGKPAKGEDGMDVWLKNKPAVREYYKEVADWYKKNSVPSKDSQDRYDKLTAELSNARRKTLKEKGKTSPDPDKVAYYEANERAITSLMDKIYDSVNNQFKIAAVQPNDSYKNPKYAKLIDAKGNPIGPAGKYYQALLNIYTRKQKMLGQTPQPRNSWESFSYIAPSMRSEGLEKVQKDGAWSAVKDSVKDTFQFLSTDVNYGDAINANKESRNKMIPIHYVNPLDEKLVSRDIASSLVLFAGMTNMFRRKSEIVGSVMVMRDIIQKREVLNVDAGNNPRIHRFSKMLKGTKLSTKPETGGRNFDHLNEWIDKIFFGEDEIKETFNILGKQVSANKLSNKLAGFTALNTLAFNLLQATNQFALDNVRMTEEAHSQQFFNKKNMMWAKSMYMFSANGARGTLKDYKAFTPTSKLVNAIQYFDALGESFKSAGEDKTGPRSLKLIKEIPMSLQTLIEHEVATTRMLALMDSYKGVDHTVKEGETLEILASKYKVKIDGIKQWNKLKTDKITPGQVLKIGKLLDAKGEIIKNEDGTYANLWDVFVQDKATGKFGIDPKVANFNRALFMGRISGINKRTNQVKTKFDDAIIQRRWYGKLLMLFRRYFVPSLRKYYGHNGLRGGIHRDLEMGTVSEGMLETLARFVKESWQNKSFGVYKMMTPMEQQNMRRLSINMLFYAVAGLIIMAFSDDDDEDDSWAESFAIYQALRMQSELTQFMSVQEFAKLAVSPSAGVKPGLRALDLGDHFVTVSIPSFFTGDTSKTTYQRKSGIHEKGDSKLMAKIQALLPIIGGIDKSSDPKAAAKWFDLPAASTK
jgi:LysM repeat protein